MCNFTLVPTNKFGMTNQPTLTLNSLNKHQRRAFYRALNVALDKVSLSGRRPVELVTLTLEPSYKGVWGYLKLRPVYSNTYQGTTRTDLDNTFMCRIGIKGALTLDDWGDLWSRGRARQLIGHKATMRMVNYRRNHKHG